MRKWIVVSVLVIIAAAAAGYFWLSSPPAPAKEKVRVGYWTSGVSLGFGTVLEELKFLEKEGLDVEFVRFPDLAAQIRALASGSIDVTFGSPLSAIYAADEEGVPVVLIGASQPADAVVVVPEDSPVKTLADLKGKKVGGTYPTAAVSVLLNTIADQGYGVKPEDFLIVAGNESRLVQFLAQKQVDASVLRTVTLDQVGKELKLKTIANLGDEWKKITKNDAPPYIGTVAATTDFAVRNPDAAARVIRGLIEAQKWGSANKDQVATIMEKKANLPEKDARVFASRWDSMYRTAFDPVTIKTLKLEHEAFKKVGVIKGQLNEAVFVTEPYKKATGQ